MRYWMSTGPSGVSSCVSSGPKFPYGLGFSPSRTAGTSILTMLMRIVAFSVEGGAGACSRRAASRLQSQGMGDDLFCLVRQSIRVQRGRIGQGDVAGVRAAAQSAPGSVTQVIHQHEVILHRASIVVH